MFLFYKLDNIFNLLVFMLKLECQLDEMKRIKINLY